MSINLGTVIAQRRLAVTGDPEANIMVRIGAPQPYPDASPASYFCPYQITGIGDQKVRRASGVDAVQALEMLVLVLPLELEVLARKHADLRWEHAADAGDFGFSERLLSATRGRELNR